MTYLTDARIFFCLTPTKMTYSFDSLMNQAEKIFARNPLSGHLFLFLNRDRDRIKISRSGIRMAFAFGTNAWRQERFNCQALPGTNRASSWTRANCTGC